MENQKNKEFTDNLLIAYLDLVGYQIRPKVNNKTITFEVIGNNIEGAIQDFYCNPKVPILNFCSSYKKIRSMIFNMKGQ